MLFELLKEIKDERREQGKKYLLGEVLMCSILAIISGGISYRKIHTFIKKRFDELSVELNLNWDKAPSYTTIRSIIQGIKTERLETCFRKYVEKTSTTIEESVISCDGKTLRGSYNNMRDQTAIHVLNIYNTENKMMLGPEKVSEKTNEIPV